MCSGLKPDFEHDSAVATGVIKHWLTLLPNGLLDCEVTKKLIQATNDVDAIEAIVNELPEVNFKTLMLLVIHW